MMRIRKTFAGAFVVLLLIAASLGLAPNRLPQYKQSDKVLHFVTFFLLTLCFYWIVETNRRRVVQVTLVACTAGLGIGSEVLQGLLPNGREFDPYDIVANLIGSVLALLACSWYHKRMLERRRATKSYHAVPGDDLDDEHDVELGERVASEGQETEVVYPPPTTVTEELDNWDENAEDWDDGEAPAAEGEAQTAAGNPTVDAVDSRKRSE